MTWVNVGGAVSGGSTVTSPYASEAELAAVRIPLATGSTTARSLADRFADVVNVKDFGAKGDGVTDDTAGGRAAITEALTFGKRLYWPTGSYLVRELVAPEIFRVNGPITIEGDGPSNTFLTVASNVPGTCDIFHYVADTAAGFKHLSLRNITIVPASGAPGNYAICIDTTTGPIADLTMERIATEQLGGGSIRTINPLLTNGFFTSTIRENSFVGGILFERAGDSIRIWNNTITGNGRGIDWDSVSGANVGSIQGNNITSKDSAIRLRSSYRTVIRDNNLEPWTGGGYSGNPVIDVSGSVASVYEPKIEGNTILASLVSNTDAIRFDNVINPVVGPNTIYTAGTGVGIVTTANTIIPKVDRLGSAWAVGPTQINDVSGQALERFYVPVAAGGALSPRNDAGATQAGRIFMGSGAPNNANGNNGDFYLRTDTPATANQRLYNKQAGAWVGLL